MEDILKNQLKDSVKENFLRAVISNPREKNSVFKIKIRPVTVNRTVLYQATEYVGTQVFHHNYTDKEIVEYMYNMTVNSFKQCEIMTNGTNINILVSKKGKITINKKKTSTKLITTPAIKENLSHNRKKNYILEEGIAVPFLIDLGVMNKQGDVVKARYDKFRQINRFLEFIRDIEGELPKDREVTIIDFGCGKSYLTFAIYYYLHELRGLDISITGLDLKEDVIKKCNFLAEKYGYDKLIFKTGDIAEYSYEKKVDMVVTLHACDTATDYALYKAVNWGAKVILSVPCCQHEVNRQIKNDMMSPVLNYGILKERMSAIITDAVRAEVLKVKGYKTDILEFIDMEHTPKNLLIRGVKGNVKGNKKALDRMISEFNIEPSVVALLGLGNGGKDEEHC